MPSSRTCRFGGLTLAQLSNVFHRGHHQAYAGLRIFERRLGLLIIEYLGSDGIHHAPGEARDLVRLRQLDGSRRHPKPPCNTPRRAAKTDWACKRWGAGGLGRRRSGHLGRGRAAGVPAGPGRSPRRSVRHGGQAHKDAGEAHARKVADCALQYLSHCRGHASREARADTVTTRGCATFTCPVHIHVLSGGPA